MKNGLDTHRTVARPELEVVPENVDGETRISAAYQLQEMFHEALENPANIQISDYLNTALEEEGDARANVALGKAALMLIQRGLLTRDTFRNVLHPAKGLDKQQ